MIAIIIYILVNLLFGSISCLFGKKLYFPILMLTVFSTVVTISFSAFELNLKVGIITVLVGIAAAVLARVVYKLGVFLLGGILGGVIGLFLTTFLPAVLGQYGWIIVLLLVLLFGICAIKWCDFFIMASTSFNGAFTMVLPICFLVVEFHNLQKFVYADGMFATITNLNRYINNQLSPEYEEVIFIAAMILAIGGFIFQIVTNKKRP